MRQGKRGGERDTKNPLAGRRANNKVTVHQFMPELVMNILGFISQKGRKLSSKNKNNGEVYSWALFFSFCGGTSGVFIKPLTLVYNSWVSVILVNQLTLFYSCHYSERNPWKGGYSLMNNKSCKIIPWMSSFLLFPLCSLSSKSYRFWLCVYKKCQLCILISINLSREKKKKTSKHMELEAWWRKNMKWWLSLMNTDLKYLAFEKRNT